MSPHHPLIEDSQLGAASECHLCGVGKGKDAAVAGSSLRMHYWELDPKVRCLVPAQVGNLSSQLRRESTVLTVQHPERTMRLADSHPVSSTVHHDLDSV